jgi:hypothetical protein
MRTGLLAGCAAVFMLCGPAYGQAAYTPPTTSWGAPDLEGVWTNASVTKLTRMAGADKLVLTPEEARRIESSDFNNARTAIELQPTDQSTGAPEKGKALPSVGNYNAVWVDPGSKISVVRGELRSSWITDPADGRIPMSAEGRRLMQAAQPKYNPGRTVEAAPPKPAASPARTQVAATADAAAKPFVDLVTAPRSAPGGEAAANYIGPESRGLGERCIVLRASGPVITNGLYNNNIQINQSPDSIVMVVEMVHDARVIKMAASREEAARLPSTGVAKWMGEAVGWFEGQTLVVESRNYVPYQSNQVFLSPAGKLTERFTRLGPDEILYEFEVNDPAVYTQVWRGETAWLKNPEGMYEFACHEGNYGLENILKGARQMELRGEMLELTGTEE